MSKVKNREKENVVNTNQKKQKCKTNPKVLIVSLTLLAVVAVAGGLAGHLTRRDKDTNLENCMKQLKNNVYTLDRLSTCNGFLNDSNANTDKRNDIELTGKIKHKSKGHSSIQAKNKQAKVK